MVRHSRAGGAADLRHGSIARPPEIVKTGQVRQPDRKIDILALMQKLDPEAPVRLKARDLARQRTSHAAEQRDTLHLGKRHEARRHSIGGGPEGSLTEQLVAILLGDLSR